MNTSLVRDLCQCVDMIVRELVGTVTENGGFSMCLLNMCDHMKRHRETKCNGIVVNRQVVFSKIDEI